MCHLQAVPLRCCCSSRSRCGTAARRSVSSRASRRRVRRRSLSHRCRCRARRRRPPVAAGAPRCAAPACSARTTAPRHRPARTAQRCGAACFIPLCAPVPPVDVAYAGACSRSTSAWPRPYNGLAAGSTRVSAARSALLRCLQTPLRRARTPLGPPRGAQSACASRPSRALTCLLVVAAAMARRCRVCGAACRQMRPSGMRWWTQCVERLRAGARAAAPAKPVLPTHPHVPPFPPLCLPPLAAGMGPRRARPAGPPRQRRAAVRASSHPAPALIHIALHTLLTQTASAAWPPPSWTRWTRCT
jgi:hypothetical protein